MDDARKATSARTTLLLLAALASAFTQVGCAGGNTWRPSAGALAGSLWSRPPAQPGYDLYAQNMADSRGPDAPKTALADHDAAKGVKPRPTDDAGVAEGPAKASSPFVAAQPDQRGRTDDSVRVTLGRPESLRILKDPGVEPSPALAATAEPQPLFKPARAAESARVQPRPEKATEPDPSPAELTAAPEAVPPAAVVADSTADERPVIAKVNSPGEVQGQDADQKLRSVLAEAKERLDALSTYQVDISRVERVGSQLQPEEDALLSIRRKPKAVRLEWPTGPSKGREVIYSAAINDRMMHVNIANSAIPIPRMSIPVDSPLAMRSSRHAITEAGFDTIFDNLFQQLEAPGNTPPPGGRLTYKGLQKPKELDQTCHLIQRITPAKEIWRVYLDPTTLMPTVVTAHQADGELIECYKYTNLQINPTQLASADAFDPDKRWGESKGLFSRLAKAASSATDAPSATTTR